MRYVVEYQTVALKLETRPTSGRRLFLLLLLGGAVLVPLLVAAFGPVRTFSLWNIPVLQPGFADAHAVSAGAESWRAGQDPLVANPVDPWNRVSKYPRVWQAASRLGLAQRHTTAIALVMIAAFMAGLVLFVREVDHVAAGLLAVAVFSPAVMLGIERGNGGLLIFFLCAAALFALRRSPSAAAVLLTVAGLLKYFPFFGLICLVRAPRRSFQYLAGAAALTAAVYLALTWREVVLAVGGVARGTFVSYRASVGWMAARGVVISVAAVSVLLLAVDELANWALLGGMAYLLAGTAPWVGVAAGELRPVDAGREPRPENY
jgi:hypothetical protein